MLNLDVPHTENNDSQFEFGDDQSNFKTHEYKDTYTAKDKTPETVINLTDLIKQMSEKTPSNSGYRNEKGTGEGGNYKKM